MLKLFNPEQFQGPKSLTSRKGYFEGWYYKSVSLKGEAIAIIIGVAINSEDKHAFIQTIDGEDGSTTYDSFDISEFSVIDKPFSISLGKNFFSRNMVIVGDRTEISGKIELTNSKTLPVNIFRPGIMGWFRYLPRMECYHGVVSLRHSVDGSLLIGSKKISFIDSHGYIEKDWGNSFPESYIWMQSNSFSKPDCSFMISIAKIPWLNKYFSGFLGFLNIEDRIIIFSTYTASAIRIIDIDENKTVIVIAGRGIGLNSSLKRGENIIIEAKRKKTGSLIAPAIGYMDRRIGESIDAIIRIKYFKNRKLIFDDIGRNCGMEIVGDFEELK